MLLSRKAQRLISELSKTDYKNDIYSHKSILKINSCYKRLGKEIISTKAIENIKNPNELKGSIVLLPPSLNKANYIKNFKNVQTAFASGWMSIRALKKRSGYDIGFVFSDLSDWDGLLYVVKESEAKKCFFIMEKVKQLINI